MSSFNNSKEKLDQLIEKLEANTGGQYISNSTQLKQINQKQKSKPDKLEVKQEEVKEQLKGQINKQIKVESVQIQSDTKITEDKVPIKEKKQKKEKTKQAKDSQQNDKKKQVGPEMFSLIDMRIGCIEECWKHPESENLYCEKITVCGVVRNIASGLQKFVPLDAMKGWVIVMANLKPRPLAGFQSNGMVVCSSNKQHTNIELLRPQGNLGDRIYLQGYENLFQGGDILPVLNPKKKILQKCLEHFETDGEGFVVWNGIRLRTAQGYLKSTIINGKVS